MATHVDIADQKIGEYFHQGYTYSEIQMLLSLNDAIDIRYRSLKRRLKKLGLKKRGNWSLEEIVNAAELQPVEFDLAQDRILQEEIEGSGQVLGCRSLTRRLLSKHGIAAGRNTVMSVLKSLDPEGVELRIRNRITRRRYYNKGPNFVIHVDGYDKLKPFGFAIHGAVCGYSRRLLWLRVARTNNNPKVIASYFLDYVQEITGVPRCVRVDGGTENGHLLDMQKAFRWNDDDVLSGDKSVLVGCSTSNQRIERWWRSLRQMGIGFWIDFFKDLEFQGNLSTGSEIHLECLRFCFMRIIQQELDNIRNEWNHHPIRFQPRQVDGCPSGKPEMMFSHPELYGSIDYKFPVNPLDIESLKVFCEYPTSYGCTEEVKDQFLGILRENGKVEADNAKDAKELFIWFLQYL